MSILNNSLLLGADLGGYQIARSLRFNSSDSAYLSRTPASAGNRKTWTFSLWVKRSAIGTNNELFTAGTDVVNGPGAQIALRTGSDIRWTSYSGAFQLQLITTQVFRDPSAWYHLLFSVDTTQATAANRARIFVNGSQVTTFSTETYPSQNTDLLWNQAALQGIATNVTAAGSSYFDGYLADIHFIDGQALAPSSFAETNATTGQWVPKAYSGTYGTNGFQLKFADNSNNTATTLGKDYSGNGNNWTPNNLSVTAGAGNDSTVDTPTSYGTDTGAGGEVRGNYATLNPLIAEVTPINGNLERPSTSAAPAPNYSTIGMSSGKWYFEYQNTATNTLIGVWGNGNSAMPKNSYPTYYWDIGAASAGALGLEKTSGSASGTLGSFAANDIFGVALDIDNTTLYFYRNGSLIQTITGMSFIGQLFFVAGSWSGGPSAAGVANFGQRPFAYTAPSGFKALCDTNLPAPVVAKPNQYFGVGLYTGNNGSNTITTGIDNTANAGLLWIKNRTTAVNHNIYDKVRGYSSLLELPTTAAEYSYSVSLAETSTGYTLNTSSAQFNASGSSYVAWNWAAGSSTVTNTQGSITSQVRANASAGFSIVTYTGTGSAATVGHGLGVAPAMIITKGRTNTAAWLVYHQGIGATNFVQLNTTIASTASITAWNDTAPTSTVFSIGTSAAGNTSGVNNVAYCFAPVAGYSSFGSYTANNSADGPFIYTGFRPTFILFKASSRTSDWSILDAARNRYNVSDATLSPNLSNAEVTGTSTSYAYADFLSNGFKIRGNSSAINDLTNTYIYAAFAENPFQYARAR